MSSATDRPRRTPESTLIELLEERLLLTTLFGGDTFEYISRSPDLNGVQTVRVSVTGDIIAELVAADIDPSNNTLLLGDLSGVYVDSAGDPSTGGLGQTEILDGRGGTDGIRLIGFTSMTDLLWAPGNAPDQITLNALASQDAAGNGATYAFNVATVSVPSAAQSSLKVVQLAQLDNNTGAGTVRAMLQQASLNEDVISHLSTNLPQANAFAIDPTTGMGYAVGDVLNAHANFVSTLYSINPSSGQVTTIGPLTNTSHLNTPSGGAVTGISAMTFDSTGQLFILAVDYTAGATLGGITGLCRVDKNTGEFSDAQATALTAVVPTVPPNPPTPPTPMSGVNSVLFTGMAFDPDNDSSLYAVSGRALYQIGVTAAPSLNANANSIGAVSGGTGGGVEGLAFAQDASDNTILVGLEVNVPTDITLPPTARLLRINPATAAGADLSTDGGVRTVYDLASYTRPGDTRPLLYAVDAGTGDFIRGSAVSLAVDPTSGATAVDAIAAADFAPRIGSPDDGMLFFVVRAGTTDSLYEIDTTPNNRSATQNSLIFRGNLETGTATIDSIAWDQTSPTTATLYAAQNTTAGPNIAVISLLPNGRN